MEERLFSTSKIRFTVLQIIPVASNSHGLDPSHAGMEFSFPEKMYSDNPK